MYFWVKMKAHLFQQLQIRAIWTCAVILYVCVVLHCVCVCAIIKQRGAALLAKTVRRQHGTENTWVHSLRGVQRVTEPERDKETQWNKQPAGKTQNSGSGTDERTVNSRAGGGATFRDAREYGGTLPSYFPEMIPQASGDQVIAPTPEKKTMELLLLFKTSRSI